MAKTFKPMQREWVKLRHQCNIRRTDDQSHDEVLNSSMNSLKDNANDDGDGDASDYWLEVKAIIGGVLGFWGGVGSLGALFLIIVISQRYCCKKGDDEKDGEFILLSNFDRVRLKISLMNFLASLCTFIQVK